MADKEKVVYGLKCILGGLPTVPAVTCPTCHYKDSGGDFGDCVEAIAKDALELLKEQEAVVRCKDCIYREDKKKCVVAFVADKQDFPVSYYDKYGEWFCADGKRR